MRRRIAMLALGLAPALALAHHGWSEYDSTRLLKLSGTVVEAGYEHPHGFIRLATPGKTWLCVLAPPSRMDARGLAKDALKKGARHRGGLRQPQQARGDARRTHHGGWQDH